MTSLSSHKPSPQDCGFIWPVGRIGRVAALSRRRLLWVRNPHGSPSASVAQLVEQRSEEPRVAGSNPARHTIRPLRQVGPSRQPLKLESAVRVCQGSYKHLCQKGASCRGRLTVGQQLAKLPSRKSRHVSSNLTLCAICLLVRVVDETGPENRRWETVRRFESFSKRHCPHSVQYLCR